MRSFRFALISSVLLFAASAAASIFGSVQGLIHDPQHRPVKGAQVTIVDAPLEAFVPSLAPVATRIATAEERAFVLNHLWRRRIRET